MSRTLCLFIFIIFLGTEAQVLECPLPDDTSLTDLLNNTLISYEGVNSSLLFDLSIEDKAFTCLAAGQTLHKYRSFSVVVQYSTSPSEETEYAQFQAECMFGVVWDVGAGEFEYGDETYMSRSLRDDCVKCTSWNNDNNCIICEYIN